VGRFLSVAFVRGFDRSTTTLENVVIRLLVVVALAVAGLAGCVVAPYGYPAYGYYPAPAYYAAPAVGVGVVGNFRIH
jgi:hypothetical protein